MFQENMLPKESGEISLKKKRYLHYIKKNILNKHNIMIKVLSHNKN